MSVAGSAIARRFDSPILSRIAAPKDAELASQAALDSVARLKASRAAGPAAAPKAAGAGSRTEQEPEGIPFGEYGARSPVDRDLPRHKVCAWMVVKGRGNDRCKGFGDGGHGWGWVRA